MKVRSRNSKVFLRKSRKRTRESVQSRRRKRLRRSKKDRGYTRYKRTHKNRKSHKLMGAALSSSESIKDEDVLYMDDNVCILKPTVKKGIIVWTHYTQPDGDSLCDVGLKTGKQLKDEGVDFGRNIFHPYHFFRAPYYSGEIDYSTLETEISSSYGEEQLGITKSIYIRVDPDRTFVFSSEIRVEIRVEIKRQQYLESEIEKSRKTLTDYLNIIKANKSDIRRGIYNLYTSKKVIRPVGAHSARRPDYPYNDLPIERNSEILVSIGHLTPEYFVHCT
jgi:hypothetical protein